MATIEDKIGNIKGLASKNGWTLKAQKDDSKLRFVKNNDICDVWYTKMTVGTTTTHPYKGRNTLYRKRVSLLELEDIFKTVRVHTGKGYYKNPKPKKRKKITVTKTDEMIVVYDRRDIKSKIKAIWTIWKS